MTTTMTREEKLKEAIQIKCFNTKFITKKIEQSTMKVAIKNNISMQKAQTILKEICSNDYILESEIDEKAIEVLQQFLIDDDKIDKKEFENTVGIIKSFSKNKLSDRDIKKKLKLIIKEKGWKVKDGLLNGGKWFSEI